MSEKYKTYNQDETHIEEKNIVDSPKQYKVILHNDDYTPMDFVVEILIDIFKKDEATATKIMLTVHNQGKAVCGVYTYEIAETKITETRRLAKMNGYPLHVSMETE